MAKAEAAVYRMRKRIEEENLSAPELLELAQPLLIKSKPTVADWEKVEFLLARALRKLKVESSPHPDSEIKKVLAPLMPASFCSDPYVRERLLLGLKQLHYQLSYNTSFEQLVTKLLPRKRELQAELAATLGDLNLLAQALRLTLELQRRFSATFGRLLRRIGSVIRALRWRCPSPIIEEIKQFCNKPIAQFDGPYEENEAKFDKLLTLYGQLKELAKQHCMERFFQPALAEQLEVELAARIEKLSTQVSLQERIKGNPMVRTTSIVRLKQSSIVLRPWEIDALIALRDQISEMREAAAQEALRRWITLVAALEDRKHDRASIQKEDDSAQEYLHLQLRSTAQQLEWLASYPCRTQTDIQLAANLRLTYKRWNCYLEQPQPEVKQLSACS